MAGGRPSASLQVIGAQMNVAYAVAVALLDGDVLIDEFTTGPGSTAMTSWALIDKTLDASRNRPTTTSRSTSSWLTQVRLTLDDGSTPTAKVVHPHGTGNRILTNADIRDKYATLTHRIISAERQAAIEKAVLGIDTLDDVAQLTASLLTPKPCTHRSTEDRRPGGTTDALTTAAHRPVDHSTMVEAANRLVQVSGRSVRLGDSGRLKIRVEHASGVPGSASCAARASEVCC